MKNFLIVCVLLLIMCVGCNSTPNCIDKLISCKYEFNDACSVIINDIKIPDHDIKTVYTPRTTAMNTQLNILLRKARANKGKPFEKCDIEVATFCNYITELKIMYNNQTY